MGSPTMCAESHDSLTFIGTATTRLRLGRFTLLIDPNVLHRGQRAYLGNGLWSRRLTDPSMPVEALPGLDAVLLSHLHGDHFDRVSRKGLDRDVPMITTQSAAKRLRRCGVQTHGLALWDRHVLQSPNSVSSSWLMTGAAPGKRQEQDDDLSGRRPPSSLRVWRLCRT